MVLPYIRFAAGVCVVSSGLLIGAGGIAAADAESGGATAQDTGDPGPTAPAAAAPVSTPTVGPSTRLPVSKVTDSLTRTLSGVTTRVGSGRTPGVLTLPSATISPKLPDLSSGLGKVDLGGITSTVTDAVVPGRALPRTPAVPDVVPFANALGSLPALATPLADFGASFGTAPAQLVAPVADVIASVPAVAKPVVDVVESVPSLVAPATDVVNYVPDFVARSSGVIAAGQYVPFTLAVGGFDAMSLFDPDFTALFGGGGLSPAVLVRGQRVGGGGLSATPSLLSNADVLEAPLFGPVAAPQSMSWTGAAPGVAPFVFPAPAILMDTNALAIGSAAPESTVANLLDAPMQLAQLFGDALRDASAWELLLVALPGLVGLVMMTGAGVHVGQRQAKAGFAMRVSGIARFAPSGPMGIVRSGSIVAVHRKATGAARFMDRVA